MPTANCFCSEGEPPLNLSDNSDSCTQVDYHTVQDLDDWCSGMTDFSSVDRLHRAMDKARIEAQTYFDLNTQFLTDLSESQQTAEQELAALRSQHVAFIDENKRNSNATD